jgi:hypothetical protein
MEAAGRPHFGALLRQFRQRCLKLRRLFNNRPKKEIKQKDPVSVSEAARILHAPTSRLRELPGERRSITLNIGGNASYYERRSRTSSTGCQQYFSLSP